MKTKKILVRGDVQDVGFRYSSKVKAEELGLAGYVKNLLDGSVEIIIQGEKNNLEQFCAWAKTGPRHAAVWEIKITEVENPEKFSDFSIRP